MDASTTALVGVAVGATVTFLVNLIAIWKDRLQHNRTLRSEKERWVRDKLHEIYGNCIYYLSHPKIGGWYSSGQFESHKVDYEKIQRDQNKINAQNEAERQKWLNLLIIHHPRRGTNDFEHFVMRVRNNEIRAEDITELAASDPRLKADYGRRDGTPLTRV